AVIVDKDSGDVHQLNPTANYIWDCFDGHTAIAEVCEQVSDDFNIDLSRAKQDVSQVVNDLKALELLVEYKG
ncbi:MAG: PqqD family protein, partial [Gammaproteobacteria bacterium]|nr:PqqD family protein [Gammaproteobacteria bacterium]